MSPATTGVHPPNNRHTPENVASDNGCRAVRRIVATDNAGTLENVAGDNGMGNVASDNVRTPENVASDNAVGGPEGTMPSAFDLVVRPPPRAGGESPCGAESLSVKINAHVAAPKMCTFSRRNVYIFSEDAGKSRK